MPIQFKPQEFVRSVSDHVDCLVLLANAAQSFTVPAGYSKVLFACTGPTLWVDVTNEAVIPIASITDGTAPMLNPASLFVVPGATISCISPTTCAVVAEYYT